MIFSALSPVELGAIPTAVIAVTGLAANLTIFGLLTLAYLALPVLRSDRVSFTSVYQTATRWNVPLGLVVTLTVFGAQAAPVTAIIMITSIPVINLANVVFMVLALRTASAPGRQLASALLLNPLLLACLAGLVATGLELRIWSPVTEALEMTGSVAPAAMLLGMGSGMHGANLLERKGSVISASAARLFLMPALYLGFGIVLGLPLPLAMIGAVFAAMPTAPNGYFLARQLGGDARLYTSILTVQTAISLVTIPFWIWLAQLT